MRRRSTSGPVLTALVTLLAIDASLARDVAADEGPGSVGSILEIDGNLVLVDEVYVAVLDLPPRATATADTAHRVERQIVEFLRRAGYSLARVDAWVMGERIRVRIDEGRVSAIVVRGRDTVTTLAVRLALDLPYDVFNRPQLERLLQPYRDTGAKVSYTLVPTRKVKHRGVQLDPLALLPGSEPQPVPGAYELHLQFTGQGSRGGFKLRAHLDPSNILAGGQYSWVSGLLHDDRWELGAQVGANYFEDLESQADDLRFSRVFADARWFTPRFAWQTLRVSLRLREDLMRRQRQDLRLEQYWWNRLEGAVGIAVEPWTASEVTLEVGAEQSNLFGIEQLDDVEGVARIDSSSTLHGFLGLTAMFVLEPTRLRIDRRHRLELDARMFGGLDDPALVLDAEYKKVFELGWNDLWLRGAIAGVAGGFGFEDAIPMSGSILRGVFGHRFYLDRAATVGVEYRVSLTRDVFKLGVFHEAAVFREAPGSPDRTRELLAGNSFGPSFHALVMDVLQFNLYYSFGFTLEREFDHGVSLRLEKAF